jgi:hypothetical protein
VIRRGREFGEALEIRRGDASGVRAREEQRVQQLTGVDRATELVPVVGAARRFAEQPVATAPRR